MGSRACFSFLTSDPGVSPGIYSSPHASCCPELSSCCLCDLWAGPACQDWAAGFVSVLCFGPCFWAVNVDTMLRGIPTPNRAFSSGEEFLVTPEGCREPHSYKICICESFMYQS